MWSCASVSFNQPVGKIPQLIKATRQIRACTPVVEHWTRNTNRGERRERGERKGERGERGEERGRKRKIEGSNPAEKIIAGE